MTAVLLSYVTCLLPLPRIIAITYVVMKTDRTRGRFRPAGHFRTIYMQGV
jgi:hypothetical protein